VASHPWNQREANEVFDRPIRDVDVLAEGFETLAEVLRAGGYRTGAFVANPWLDRRFGFAQGFEHYDDSFGRWGERAGAPVRAALEWLAGVPADQRFFLYVHSVDSHQPYPQLAWRDVRARADELAVERRPLPDGVRFEIARRVRFKGRPEGATPPTPSLELIEMAYDAGIAAFDESFRVLLEGLEARPDYRRMAVLVTSDHGEALYDRGYGSHGKGLHDDEVAIPLVARLPFVKPDRGRVDCATDLVDLLPTLCDYLRLTCPEPVSGRSLLGPRRGAPLPRRYMISEGVVSKPRHRSIRNRRFKLIFEPEGRPGWPRGHLPYSLYDTQADPGEERDLIADDAASAETLRVFERLARELSEAVPPFEPPDAETAPLDVHLEERLRTLGYVE
jgi:arylsulfatase A-like enzyme